MAWHHTIQFFSASPPPLEGILDPRTLFSLFTSSSHPLCALMATNPNPSPTLPLTLTLTLTLTLLLLLRLPSLASSLSPSRSPSPSPQRHIPLPNPPKYNGPIAPGNRPPPPHHPSSPNLSPPPNPPPRSPIIRPDNERNERKLNSGERLGILFAIVAGVMQFVFVGFLAIKRWQLGRTDRGFRERDRESSDQLM